MISPSFNDDSRLCQRVKNFSIQEFEAHFSVKRFAVSIFPRTAGLDIKWFHLEPFEPVFEKFRDELWTVVRSDVLWAPMLKKKIGKNQDYILRSNSSGDKRGKTFTRELIDDIENLVGRTIVSSICHKIVGPDVVSMLGSQSDK